jgi:putative SOS response-associated peptidase YedK
MCFHSKQSKSAQELKHRFNATFENEDQYVPSENINGFTFPATPVITHQQPDKIQLFHWGLIPSWAKDNSIRKNTLNAKIETIHEKPSFRASVNHRCLIIADGFYEWQWLDEKGKKKQKYLITIANNELFCFAGIWNTWIDKSTGEIINTYTILTTEAKGLMAQIHNSKKRMPVILEKSSEMDWLTAGKIMQEEVSLKASEI